MKVLWLTNKIIPRVAESMGQHSTFVNEGWLGYTFDLLCHDTSIQMAVLCDGTTKNEKGIGLNNSFLWFTMKGTKRNGTFYDENQTDYCKSVLMDYKPDLIHIWGSEYPHTYSMLLAAKDLGMENRVVISLQGVIYACAIHYLNFIPPKVISRTLFHDLVRRTNLKQQQKLFYIRGIYEQKAFSLASHIIGRTDWDRICVERINPNITYHFCNETLRPDFYDGQWDYEKCQKHSIFISQATYSIKGFHLFLKALPLLVKKYPDLHVYVGGQNITKNKSFIDKLKLSSYGKYLKDYIESNNLSRYITFLGALSSQQMKSQYLKANVFVSPSLIENSPNSVGEAMILGCPVISSDVGGVRSIIKHDIEGFTYPVDEFYVLEHYISWIFDHPQEAIRMGENARKHALSTHNVDNNYNQLLSIYSNIVG